MRADERAELRALCERASDGPWVVYNDPEDNDTSVEFIRESDGADFTICTVHSFEPEVRQRDAAFIAAARTAIPRLLDALERSECLRTEAQRGIEKLTRKTVVGKWRAIRWRRRAKDAQREVADLRALLEVLNRAALDPPAAPEPRSPAGEVGG